MHSVYSWLVLTGWPLQYHSQDLGARRLTSAGQVRKLQNWRKLQEISCKVAHILSMLVKLQPVNLTVIESLCCAQHIVLGSGRGKFCSTFLSFCDSSGVGCSHSQHQKELRYKKQSSGWA